MPVITTVSPEGLATLTLAAPRLKALDVELLDALLSAVDDVREARGVLRTGEGRAFSAGVDLARLVDGGRVYAHELLTARARTLTALFDLPVPLLAAVNGHVIAGGCLLALTADARLGSTGKIGLNELAIGLPVPSAAIAIAQHALGTRTCAVILHGELHAAEQAQRLGLLDQLVDAEHLAGVASGRLSQLAAVPSAAFARAKHALRAPARARWRVDEEEIADLASEWSSPATLTRLREALRR